MPKHLQARLAQDEREERQVRKLAGSSHAPADCRVSCPNGGGELGWQDAARDCYHALLSPENRAHSPESQRVRKGSMVWG